MSQPVALRGEGVNCKIGLNLCNCCGFSACTGPRVCTHFLVKGSKAELMVAGILPLGEETVIGLRVGLLSVDEDGHIRFAKQHTFSHLLQVRIIGRVISLGELDCVEGGSIGCFLFGY